MVVLSFQPMVEHLPLILEVYFQLIQKSPNQNRLVLTSRLVGKRSGKWWINELLPTMQALKESSSTGRCEKDSLFFACCWRHLVSSSTCMYASHAKFNGVFFFFSMLRFDAGYFHPKFNNNLWFTLRYAWRE